MKKWLCVLLALLMLCSSAAASVNEWVEGTEGARYKEHFVEFETEVPAELAQALEEAGLGAANVLCGALRQPQPLEGGFASIALLAVRTPSGVTLVAGSRPSNGAWTVDNLGTKMIDQSRECRIVFSSGKPCVEYTAEDGGKERYAFWWGMGADDSWVMQRYEREYGNQSGYFNVNRSGYFIANEYGDGGLRIADLGAGYGEGTIYPVNWVGWTAWMNSYLDFPTTPGQAIELAETSWQSLDGKDVVMLYGNVNLREQPTGRSRSLGKYRDGALAYVIGQKDGAHEPWYQVRVGGVEGWVSSPYARRPRTDDYHTTLFHGPLNMAQAVQETPLYASPSGRDVLMQLPAGTVAQVVAQTEDGYLHIVLADEPLHWEMNPDAAGGYVRASDVVEGSVSQLGLR